MNFRTFVLVIQNMSDYSLRHNHTFVKLYVNNASETHVMLLSDSEVTGT